MRRGREGRREDRGVGSGICPGVGNRTHESTEALAGKIAEERPRILSATVSRTAQRWFVSFTVEVERKIPDHHRRPQTVVGIDLGISSLIMAVDHQGKVIRFPGPRPLRAALRRLRRASGAHSRKKTGSASRRKSARRWARIHARMANCRLMPCTRPRPGDSIRDGGGRGPEPGRDGPQPEAGPEPGRPVLGDHTAPARLQDRLARRPAAGGRAVLPQLQDVLWLRDGESQG